MSGKAKGSDVCKTKINEYVKSINLQAEDLVVSKFPQRVFEIEALSKTASFNVSDLSPAHSGVKVIASDPILRIDNDDEIISKNRKCAVNPDSSSPGANPDNYVVPCNNHVTDAVELIKPRIYELLADIQLLKMWMQPQSIRAEDSNVLIKSVLDHLLAEIEVCENNTDAFSVQISAYFSSRAKIVSKVLKYPNIDDYRRCVRELDENFYFEIRQMLCEIKNYYGTLYCMISKNLEKIKKTKTFDPSTMY